MTALESWLRNGKKSVYFVYQLGGIYVNLVHLNKDLLV